MVTKGYSIQYSASGNRDPCVAFRGQLDIPNSSFYCHVFLKSGLNSPEQQLDPWLSCVCSCIVNALVLCPLHFWFAANISCMFGTEAKEKYPAIL